MGTISWQITVFIIVNTPKLFLFLNLKLIIDISQIRLISRLSHTFSEVLLEVAVGVHRIVIDFILHVGIEFEGCVTDVADAFSVDETLLDNLESEAHVWVVVDVDGLLGDADGINDLEPGEEDVGEAGIAEVGDEVGVPAFSYFREIHVYHADSVVEEGVRGDKAALDFAVWLVVLGEFL